MRIYQDFNLKNYNSYRLEAMCRKAYFPENDKDIVELFDKISGDYVILGGGFNVILSEKYYDKDFIIFSGNYDNITYNGENEIYCESGCDMGLLSKYTLSKELSGLEAFFDIPSSLGGAIVMNAGAGEYSINDVLIRVRYFDPQLGCFNIINKEEVGFEYRNSFFQKNSSLIVCGAELYLTKREYSIIESQMFSIKEARWAKQPREYPNAGSVFKRPEGHYVGPMIEKLGLKGFSIGGAKISEKHAGFIVNESNASGKDILDLIYYVKNAVYREYNIDLEIEQRII